MKSFHSCLDASNCAREIMMNVHAFENGTCTESKVQQCIIEKQRKLLESAAPTPSPVTWVNTYAHIKKEYTKSENHPAKAADILFKAAAYNEKHQYKVDSIHETLAKIFDQDQTSSLTRLLAEEKHLGKVYSFTKNDDGITAMDVLAQADIRPGINPAYAGALFDDPAHSCYIHISPANISSLHFFQYAGIYFMCNTNPDANFFSAVCPPFLVLLYEILAIRSLQIAKRIIDAQDLREKRLQVTDKYAKTISHDLLALSETTRKLKLVLDPPSEQIFHLGQHIRTNNFFWELKKPGIYQHDWDTYDERKSHNLIVQIGDILQECKRISAEAGITSEVMDLLVQSHPVLDRLTGKSVVFEDLVNAFNYLKNLLYRVHDQAQGYITLAYVHFWSFAHLSGKDPELAEDRNTMYKTGTYTRFPGVLRPSILQGLTKWIEEIDAAAERKTATIRLYCKEQQLEQLDSLRIVIDLVPELCWIYKSTKITSLEGLLIASSNKSSNTDKIEQKAGANAWILGYEFGDHFEIGQITFGKNGSIAQRALDNGMSCSYCVLWSVDKARMIWQAQPCEKCRNTECDFAACISQKWGNPQ